MTHALASQVITLSQLAHLPWTTMGVFPLLLCITNTCSMTAMMAGGEVHRPSGVQQDIWNLCTWADCGREIMAHNTQPQPFCSDTFTAFEAVLLIDQVVGHALASYPLRKEEKKNLVRVAIHCLCTQLTTLTLCSSIGIVFMYPHHWQNYSERSEAIPGFN